MLRLWWNRSTQYQELLFYDFQKMQKGQGLELKLGGGGGGGGGGCPFFNAAYGATYNK